jgi:hypothetical protein
VVCRGEDDIAVDRVRVRLWDTATEPGFDSEWVAIHPGETLTLAHSLDIAETELTVSLWFRGTDLGIHQMGYGGLAIDPAQALLGAHWHGLTRNTVSVTRHPGDTDVEQVRLLVVHGTTPHYDSLEDLGEWQEIDAGDTHTFTHGLSWNANMMMVRAECYSPDAGIHQWLAGGNHHWDLGWKGAALRNLTEDTVGVHRWVDDDICPRVRVRIWRRSVRQFLPLVIRNP